METDNNVSGLELQIGSAIDIIDDVKVRLNTAMEIIEEFKKSLIHADEINEKQEILEMLELVNWLREFSRLLPT